MGHALTVKVGNYDASESLRYGVCPEYGLFWYGCTKHEDGVVILGINNPFYDDLVNYWTCSLGPVVEDVVTICFVTRSCPQSNTHPERLKETNSSFLWLCLSTLAA